MTDRHIAEDQNEGLFFVVFFFLFLTSTVVFLKRKFSDYLKA